MNCSLEYKKYVRKPVEKRCVMYCNQSYNKYIFNSTISSETQLIQCDNANANYACYCDLPSIYITAFQKIIKNEKLNCCMQISFHSYFNMSNNYSWRPENEDKSYYRHIAGLYKPYNPELNRALRSDSVERQLPAGTIWFISFCKIRIFQIIWSDRLL